tara:strand:+ start:196 stop:378 length:183 start_codon:yes stop_codon:yes gene_type:complete
MKEKPPALNRYAQYIYKGKNGYSVRYKAGTQFEGVHLFFTRKDANKFIDKYKAIATPEAK